MLENTSRMTSYGIVWRYLKILNLITPKSYEDAKPYVDMEPYADEKPYIYTESNDHLRDMTQGEYEIVC